MTMKASFAPRLLSFARHWGRTLGFYLGLVDEEERVFARIYYTFDHAKWRTRETRQLRRVHRCKQ
jgi:hypothetical protein